MVLIRESRSDRGLVRLESGSFRLAIRDDVEENMDRVGLLIQEVIFKRRINDQRQLEEEKNPFHLFQIFSHCTST